jgi:hypothetical protein
MTANTVQIPRFSEYTERVVRFLGVWDINGWKLKVYAISAKRTLADAEVVSAKIIQAGHDIAAEVFTHQPEANSYGLGYVIFHEGIFATWLLLDWWADEIQLRHQLFKANALGAPAFERVTTDLIACVWELAIVAFEREAWVETMLRSPKRPDVLHYLDLHFPDSML